MTGLEESKNNINEDTGFYDDPVEVNNNFDDPYQEDTQGQKKPVDNMRLFDLGDFSLENKKTFYGRNNWNIKVGSKGRSVEMIPNDIGIKKLSSDESKTGTGTIMYAETFGNEFNFSGLVASDNVSVLENNGNKINILKDGIYKISFRFGVEFTNHIEGYIIGVSMSSGDTLFHREYASMTGIDISATGSCSGSCGEFSCSGSCSTFTTIYLDNLASTRRSNSGYIEGYFELSAGDVIEPVMLVKYEPTYTGAIKLLSDYTLLNIKYLKPKL